MKELRWLITGGTGSLGQELARQILKNYEPRTVRIFSRGELAQHEMRQSFSDTRLRYLIGDVRDKDRLYRAMHKVDVVIHCAALKQVPACEYNPIEAFKTNVGGAINVIDCAIDAEVGKVIGISSDKAVVPINAYGVTKLGMEKLFIRASQYADETSFALARFGNFRGSRGSVIPQLIDEAKKGVITVTDIGMTRWWIPLEDAAKFVLKCVEMMEDGCIYIPRMEEVALVDILNEYAPHAKWNIVGRREGEKMKELLWAENEKPEDKNGYWLIRRLPC